VVATSAPVATRADVFNENPSSFEGVAARLLPGARNGHGLMLGASDWVKLGAKGAKARLVRAAGIDLGAVRVGLAVADDLGLLAHPRPFLDGKNATKLLAALKALQASENLEVFVVGLPRELKGREGPAAKRVRAFVAQLAQATPARVELVDEWLSTREAAGRLHAQGMKAREQRGRIDSAAAAILLQSWLDGQASRGVRGED
jgi:putative Holliday junction resolvase